MAEIAHTIATATTLFLALILLGGILCLIIDWRRDYKTTSAETRMLLLPWKAEWLEFFIFLCYTFFAVFSVSLIITSAQSHVGADKMDTIWQTIWSGTAVHLVIILAIFISFRSFPNVFTFKFNTDSRLHKVPPASAIFYFLSSIPLIVVIGIGWNYLLIYLAKQGLADMPTQQSFVEMIAQADSVWATVCMGFMAIVLAPISEELLFRGCVYRFLKGKIRPMAAVTLTSLLFALMHLNSAAFLPLFLLGMLLCRCYEKTGKIYVCVGFHALFNLNTFVITLIQAWLGRHGIQL